MTKQPIAIRLVSALALMIGLTTLHSGCAPDNGTPPDEEIGVAEDKLSACDTHWTFQMLHASGSCPQAGAPFCPAQCASTGCAVKYDYVACENLPPYAPAFAPKYSFTEYCGCQAPPAVPATCSDGIQNQGETGVDTGGPCLGPQFAPCHDGIQDLGETGVDCGGLCAPCCSDGIWNHDETGVDCGGPSCPPCGGACNAPAGMFCCGLLHCALDSQYCERQASDVANMPDTFACRPLPAGCGAEPICACLQGVQCGSPCSATPSGGLMVTCLGG